MPSSPSLSRRSPSLPAPQFIQKIHHSAVPIVALVFSPQGHFLAAALQHGTILLYHVLATRSGTAWVPSVHPHPLRSFRGHTADVLHLAFSPTNFLASASIDRSVRLWHTKSSACLRNLVHPGMATAIAFHPTDENLLLTAGCDARARIWRLAENRIIAEAEAATVLTTAAFTSSRHVALGTYDGSILAWGPRAYPALTGPGVPVEKLVDTIAQARASKRFGTRAARLSVSIIDCGESRKSRAFFTADGGRLFEVRDNALLRSARTERLRKGATKLSASASSDGRFVVIDALGGSVRVMDVASAGKGRRGKKRGSVARAVEINVLGGGVHVTSAAIACEAARKRCGQCRVSGEGVMLAIGGDDGSLTIVDQLLHAL